MKKALIFGISGQDGAYLAKLLIKKKYKVYGTVRKKKKLLNFIKLQIPKKKYKIFEVDPINFKKVYQLIKKTNCNEIYYLSGVSSVKKSFNNIEKTLCSNINGFVNIAESCRIFNKKIKIYNACSSESFGFLKTTKIDETSTLNPHSPYGLSKGINLLLARNYRDNLGLHIISGISFNHDSPLRNKYFVLKKICSNIKRLVNNKNYKIELGNIDVSRDWGWTPEHVNFIYKLMQLKQSDDYIIATGKTTSLRNLIKIIFDKNDIKIEDKIIINKKNFRNSEILSNSANINKIKRVLGHAPKTDVKTLINKLISGTLF
jgi:GDPmannose 4,6-dehydratase